MSYNVKAMVNRSITVLVLVVLLAILTASSLSLFNPNFFYIHDYLHVARASEMAKGLADFHIPVRWSQNFGYGYGMPLFEFYAPLPYVFGALFYFLGLPPVSNVQALFFLSNLGSILGAYFLGKKLYGRTGGLVAASVFGLAPYRAVNLYVRGALSESWGMMFFPWVLLLGMELAQKGKIKFWPWLGLLCAVSGLLLSHNLSALQFLPTSVIWMTAYIFVYYKKTNLKIPYKKMAISLLTLLSAYLGALAVSAFYVFPALLENQFTQIEKYILNGYFDFRVHFVGLKQFFDSTFGYGGSEWGSSDKISFFLGWGAVLGSSLSIFTITANIVKKRQLPKNYWILMTSLILAIFGLFMTHGKSILVWESIGPLKYMQFPWRWLASAMIYLSIFSAGFARVFSKRSLKIVFSALVVLVALSHAVLIFKPNVYLDNSEEYYFYNDDRVQSELSQVLPDYLPITFAQITTDYPDSLVMHQENSDYVYEVKQDLVNRKVIDFSAKQSSQITFSIADFPGWETSINGSLTRHQLSPAGLIQLDIPSGASLVKVEFKNTPIRTFSDMISLFSLLGLGLGSIITYRKSK
jgi:hypothetical protein